MNNRPNCIRAALARVPLLAFLLLPPCCFAADAPPAGDAAAAAWLKVTWVQYLIVAVVPALVMLFKKIAPNTPKVLLVILCPTLGLAADWIMRLAGLDVGNPAVSAALGALGNFVHQLGKQSGIVSRSTDSHYAVAFACFACFAAGNCSAADNPQSAIRNPKFYLDSFATAATRNFSDDSYGYGLGIGYQITKSWAAEARVTHDGFDVDGNAVSDAGLRFVVGAPLKINDALRPYAFVGAGYQLQRDCWHVDPGAGIELRLSKRLSVFAETGLRATLDNTFDWTGAAGVRLRF